MRLSEILGCGVYDPAGKRVGGVHDVHFVADGPSITSDGQPSYRVDSIVLGDIAFGHRFGYGRGGDMAGPWLIKAIVRRVARRAIVIPWADVVRFDRPRIEVAHPGGEYGPPDGEKRSQ